MYCVDRMGSLGGLLKSEIVNGFTFDVGGSHVIFSRDIETLKKMLSFLGSNVVAYRRHAYVLLEEKLVPYHLRTMFRLFLREASQHTHIIFKGIAGEN